MTLIKSALELAMEKTDGIKSDKSSLAAAEGKEEGKKLAGAFFQNPGMDLAGELKKLPKEKLSAIKEGFLQIVLANLVLPRDEEDIKKLGFGLMRLPMKKNEIDIGIKDVLEYLHQGVWLSW